jgi:short chain dehydrogenase
VPGGVKCIPRSNLERRKRPICITYEQTKSNYSRRQAISGLGTGLVAVVAPRIFAAEGSSQQEISLRGKLQDPTGKYPKPPFNGQTQPWPGLASKMDPRPDHGEESYKGSGRLTGRKALITGGDSGMGRAAAIAYAREGADVAINYFPTEESDAQEVIALIKAEGRKAIALPGDLREEAFCEKLVADAVNGLDGLDILVSNAGRQQSHPSILDISILLSKRHVEVSLKSPPKKVMPPSMASCTI